MWWDVKYHLKELTRTLSSSIVEDYKNSVIEHMKEVNDLKSIHNFRKSIPCVQFLCRGRIVNIRRIPQNRDLIQSLRDSPNYTLISEDYYIRFQGTTPDA